MAKNNNNGNSSSDNSNNNNNNNSGNSSRQIPSTSPSQRSTIDKGKNGNNITKK
ncbi:hypothetical protein [Winogradskyella sp. PC D3.3]